MKRFTLSRREWLAAAAALRCAAGSARTLQSAAGPEGGDAGVVPIGSRRELFVDDWLIDKLQGAALRLQQPVPQEIAVTFDEPNEGNVSYYVRVFRDGETFHRGQEASSLPLVFFSRGWMHDLS